MQEKEEPQNEKNFGGNSIIKICRSTLKVFRHRQTYQDNGTTRSIQPIEMQNHGNTVFGTL